MHHAFSSRMEVVLRCGNAVETHVLPRDVSGDTICTLADHLAGEHAVCFVAAQLIPRTNDSRPLQDAGATTTIDVRAFADEWAGRFPERRAVVTQALRPSHAVEDTLVLISAILHSIETNTPLAHVAHFTAETAAALHESFWQLPPVWFVDEDLRPQWRNVQAELQVRVVVRSPTTHEPLEAVLDMKLAHDVYCAVRSNDSERLQFLLESYLFDPVVGYLFV